MEVKRHFHSPLAASDSGFPAEVGGFDFHPAYYINTLSKELIRRLAPQYGIDPAAAIAVALGEGGLVNRPDDIGDLAGGGSYGPFQLYAQGALPSRYRGNPQAADTFAWSPEGIKYALSRMRAAGAGGLTGPAAVNAIVRKFERPRYPDKSVAAALARLGSPSGGVASTAPYGGVAQSAEQGSFKPKVAGSNPAAPTDRRSFILQGLIRGDDPNELLSRLGSFQASQPAPRVTPSMPVRTAPVASEGVTATGFRPSFAEKLNALVAASGGKLSVSSGFRSPEHQAKLYANAVKKYGSEQAARKWVAPPGKSNHGRGIAADLSGDLGWARQNAAKFGLRFPMSWEDWHVEELGSR